MVTVFCHRWHDSMNSTVCHKYAIGKKTKTINNCIATDKLYININFNNKQLTQNTIVWLVNNIYSQYIFTIYMILAGVALNFGSS